MSSPLAAEQLCLDVTLPATQAVETQAEVSLIDTLLDHHHGNYRAAIEELLADADFLPGQLYVASCLMSSGMSRGWRPKYERVP